MKPDLSKEHKNEFVTRRPEDEEERKNEQEQESKLLVYYRGALLDLSQVHNIQKASPRFEDTPEYK